MAKDELFEATEEKLYSYVEKTIEIKNLELEINLIEKNCNVSLPGESSVTYSDIKVKNNSHYSIDEWLLLHDKKYEILLSKRIELVKNVKKIDNALTLLNDNERKVIKYRYFNRSSWFEVSKKVGYSESHCKLLRVKAINKIKNII